MTILLKDMDDDLYFDKNLDSPLKIKGTYAKMVHNGEYLYYFKSEELYKTALQN